MIAQRESNFENSQCIIKTRRTLFVPKIIDFLLYYNTTRNLKTSNIQNHKSTINFHHNFQKPKSKTLTTIVDGVSAIKNNK